MKLFLLRAEGAFPRRFLEGAAAANLLETYTGRPVTIRKTPAGRPFADGFYLSFSHCENCAALLAATFPVGVDLERRRPENAVRLAARFFSPEEARRVTQNPELFLPLWTAKESSFKITGEGTLFSALSRPVPESLTLRTIHWNGFTLTAAGAEPFPPLEEILEEYEI